MKKNNNSTLDFERGKRITELRLKHNFNQTELYEEIRKFYGKTEKDRKHKDNGKQTISTAECGGTLSIKNAIALSHIFGVSLDYIYFGTESYKPEYDYIKELTGLSDDALHTLEKYNKSDKTALFVLNSFLGSKLSSEFESVLHSFFQYYDLEKKNNELTQEYIKYARSKGFNIKNSDKFHKEFYPNTCFLKIVTDAKELADGFKKYGDTE